jgi:hypothetical protein
MKNLTLLIVFACFCMINAPRLGAEDFLGAPVIPDGKMMQKTENRLEIVSQLPCDEVIQFYKKALKGYRDIKVREWKDETHINDYGKLSWHSITISKQERCGTTVIIKKDSWGWVFGTLMLRFIGVFVLLLLLMLGIYIFADILPRSIARMAAGKQK